MSSGKKDVTKQIFELISEEHESEILSTANMHVVIYHQHIHLELTLTNFATFNYYFPGYYCEAAFKQSVLY